MSIEFNDKNNFRGHEIENLHYETWSFDRFRLHLKNKINVVTPLYKPIGECKTCPKQTNSKWLVIV